MGGNVSKQEEFNSMNNITPTTIIKKVKDVIEYEQQNNYLSLKSKYEDKVVIKGHNIVKTIKELKKDMFTAASNLEFEQAAKLRDQILSLESQELDI